MYTILDGLDMVQPFIMLVIMMLGVLFLASLFGHLIESISVVRYQVMSVVVDAIVFVGLSVRSTELVRDAREWHILAMAAERYLSGTTTMAVSYVSGKEGYIWILGLVYTIGGVAPILAVALNSCARVTTVFCTAKSAEVMCEEAGLTAEQTRVGVGRAALITAVLPSFALWAPQVLRESLTVMCVSLIVLLVFVAVMRKHLYLLVLAVLPLALLTWIRSTLGLSVAFAVAVAAIYFYLGRSPRGEQVRRAFLVVAFVSLPLSLSFIMNALGLTAERIVGSTAELAETASSGFPGLGWHATLPQIFSITVPRVFIGPFPWELRPSGVMLLAGLEWLCWVYVLVMASRTIRMAHNDGPLTGAAWVMPFFILVTGLILIGLSMTVANYGILARFRPIAVVALVPVAGLGALWDPEVMRKMRKSRERRPRRAPVPAARQTQPQSADLEIVKP